MLALKQANYSGGTGAMNVDRYKKDLDTLLNKGEELHNAIQYECLPQELSVPPENR